MGNEKVITMNAVKNRKIDPISWEFKTYTKDGAEVPLKVWQNLKCVLNRHNITLRLNLINHEIDFLGLRGSDSRNGKVTDIYSLQMQEGLRLSRGETEASIMRIAEENAYNPFLEMLKANENKDIKIIAEVFNCLTINYDYIVYEDFFNELFVKWCINVVKMSENTLEKAYRSQGVLILQGLQGGRKSTFFEKLMPNKDFFKGDTSLNPEKTDSVMQNTKYILVEWGEIDSTLKAEQSKLKQFITATDDEYRAPYAHLPERYPRRTSYCGSVNKVDFLKDETGSRRFWVIPVVGIVDIDSLEKIDIKKFWGAVYHLWKNKLVTDYLNQEQLEKLSEINSGFNFETDTTIILNEKLDWSLDKEDWDVYGIAEIADYLMIKDKKQVKIELEKKGLEYKVHRRPGRASKKGFKIPKIEVNLMN